MLQDDTIFSIRFRSNEKLQPTLEQLRNFFDSRKDEGTGSLHNDDLVYYRDLLNALELFERGLHQVSVPDLRETTQNSIMSRSHLVKPALKSAVEQYKYHLHSLQELDFKKPTAFIRSAEDEIARLKKQDERVKWERLQGMADERKRAIEGLKKLWIDLAGELSHILEYIRENLALIGKMSVQSSVLLRDDRARKKKESELIEDIKNLYKDRLREARDHGTITKERMEAARQEVAALTIYLSEFIQKDVAAIAGVYEAISGHVNKVILNLEALSKSIDQKKHQVFEDDVVLYTQAERYLISLVTDCRFDVKAYDMHDGSGQDTLLLEKRREMLNYLFDMLKLYPRTPAQSDTGNS